MTLPMIISIVAVFVALGVWLHLFVQRTLRHQLQALSHLACPSHQGRTTFAACAACHIPDFNLKNRFTYS